MTKTMANAEDRARRLVAEETLKYQAIALPGGVVTPGHDRSYLNEIVFENDFSSQTLLDIGSYLGYFCLEALRRGAAGATGLEASGESIRHARRIADLCGLAPEYLSGDFEEWEWGDRRFDVVTCLNVLHHMYDPVHAIRTMMRLARRKVVMEFLSPTFANLRLGMLSPLLAASRLAPVIVLGKPKSHVDAAARSYLFSVEAMKVLFNRHTTAFEPIGIRRSPFKDRMILTARKRSIGHLLVVAGPTSVGKSTFIRRFLHDAAVREPLQIEGDGWHSVSASRIDSLPTGALPRVVVHYDLLRPFRKSIRSHARDPATHLFETAQRISFITLMAPMQCLRKLMRDGELARPLYTPSDRKLEIFKGYEDPKIPGRMVRRLVFVCCRIRRQDCAERSADSRRRRVSSAGSGGALAPSL